MASRHNAVDLTHDSSSQDEGQLVARGQQAAPRQPAPAARALSAPRPQSGGSGAALNNHQQHGGDANKRPRLSGAAAGPAQVAGSTDGRSTLQLGGRSGGVVTTCNTSGGDSDIEDISPEEFRRAVLGPARAVAGGEPGGAGAAADGTGASGSAARAAAAAPAAAPAAGAAGAGPADADEVLITATVGQVSPLLDLPHIRPHCAAHRFQPPPPPPADVPSNAPTANAANAANAAHCPQCYCYVCDVKASDCAFWGTGRKGVDHANAHPASKLWARLRRDARGLSPAKRQARFSAIAATAKFRRHVAPGPAGAAPAAEAGAAETAAAAAPAAPEADAAPQVRQAPRVAAAGASVAAAAGAAGSDVLATAHNHMPAQGTWVPVTGVLIAGGCQPLTLPKEAAAGEVPARSAATAAAAAAGAAAAPAAAAAGRGGGASAVGVLRPRALFAHAQPPEAVMAGAAGAPAPAQLSMQPMQQPVQPQPQHQQQQPPQPQPPGPQPYQPQQPPPPGPQPYQPQQPPPPGPQPPQQQRQVYARQQQIEQQWRQQHLEQEEAGEIQPERLLEQRVWIQEQLEAERQQHQAAAAQLAQQLQEEKRSAYNAKRREKSRLQREQRDRETLAATLPS
ncbi:hypothetical protein HXX76_006261 [Chlamydomonas incerta]|uniref:Uncharacterized protein n=1 Tax=Chlamydomonas incerta TaxID=51695 RepID=A0A835W152_CHLIN|nr:hypothetical protein HXX76_006261 [Chlamydomonas incerta]|eukprot:KAG2436737.1 hypothetical protein HXX76_006261 [Chlamydomonas incerta]